MSAGTAGGRRALWRWLGWFVAANAGLYALVSLRYLGELHGPGSAAGLVYAPLALIGHSAFLAVLPPVLLLGPLIAIAPLRRTVTAGAVLLAAAGLALLVLDTNVFVERRLHLSLLLARLFEPATWTAFAVIVAIALGFETQLAALLHRWLAHRARPAGGRTLGITLVLAWLGAQGLHVWADATAHAPVTRLTSYLPLFYPVEAKRLLARLGLVDPARVQQAVLERQSARAGNADDLHYPLAPLDCTAPAGARPNVLWIVVDALRPDAIDDAATPALAAFRRESLAFADHWSGGNSSRMGAFSMFYGLPSTYFQSFYSAGRAPVLMEALRAQGYELMAASASGFGSPTLVDRTAVANFSTLVSTARDADSDAAVPQAFTRWLARRRSTAPWFALLWFNPSFEGAPPVAGLAHDGRYAANPRADKLWNGYRRAMHRVDAVVGGLLRGQPAGDTLVIVASDHGYEFDDLGLGHYGHASNYGWPQLRAVLMMRWPGRTPRAYPHRTSHFDLPATLLTELLGCRNPPSDYGVGRDLFDGVSWDWINAGSYHSHAIVEPHRLLVTYPGGLTEVLGPDLQPAPDAKLDARLVERALAELRRFYR